MAGPSYFPFFYALIAISSALMGLNASYLRLRITGMRRWKTGNASVGASSSAATSVVGSLVSCSCHSSLLLPLLTLLGSSGIAGIGVIAAVVEYQVWILAIFILLDLYLAYRVVGLIERARA